MAATSTSQRAPSEPTAVLVARTDDRRPLRPTWLLWAVLGLALVPIAASAWQHATGGWVPEGDDAWVGRRTMQVFSTDPPLIGQESTADDTMSDQGLSHPGPLAYYVMAVPYAVSGWSPVGLVLGAALIVALGAAAAVVAGWRAAGARGLVAAGIAVVLLELRLGPEWLVRPTSSVSVALPLLAALLGLWAYLRGDRLALAITVVAATYCLQTSLVVLPLASSILLAALGVALWRRRARGEAAWTRAGVAVGAAVALVWLLPVLDQLLGVGNLAGLGHYLLAAAGLAEREGTTAGALGLGPAVATFIAFALSMPRLDGRTFEGPAVWLVRLDQLALAQVALGAAAVGLAVAWCRRQRRAELGTLLVVAAAAAVISVIAFSRRPTDSLVTQTYFVVWVQAVAATLWAALALAALEAGSWATHRQRVRQGGRARRPRGALPPALAAGLGVVAVGALAASIGPVARDDAAQITELSAEVRADLPLGTYKVVADGPVPFTSTAKGLGLDLLAHGYDIRFDEWGGMVDEPQRRGDREVDHLVVTSEYPDLPDVVMLARSRSAEVDLQVHLVPGGPDLPFCLEVGGIVRGLVARADAGSAWRVDDAIVAIDAIDAGRLRTTARDPRIREASAAFEQQRPSALATLRALPPDGDAEAVELAPEFTGSLQAIVLLFDELCRPPRTG